ncbi:MAG: DEAD/DEAH box helicase [Betaproteobacteria bacterium]
MSFSSLGLTDALLRAVADVGYTQPTPIQLQAIPAVLAGGDLLAGAQTGTGKTAGFVLPILQRLAAAPRATTGRIPIRALILAPTRELAAQVEESVRVYGKYLSLTSAVVFGGVNINPQFAMLKRGVDILVATPGRLLDHAGQKTVDLKQVEVLVLDEADRMLDMGFIHDIKRVLKLLPPKRQNLLFSATFPEEIRALAATLLHAPASIQATPRNTTVELIKQTVIPVDAKRKAELLLHLVKEGNWYQVLVFTRTKHGANRLATTLEKHGVTALPIHGNKSQNARTRALAEFKSGKLQVLVATDIAARGIDIDDLPHVVNFDLPNVPEDYVHRIGRTGRAGATGEAISLMAPDEAAYLRDIERLTRRSVPRMTVPGFEPGSPPRMAVVEAPDRGPPQGRGRSGGRGERQGAPRERRDERRSEQRAPSHAAPRRDGGKPAAPHAARPAGAAPVHAKSPTHKPAQPRPQGEPTARPQRSAGSGRPHAARPERDSAVRASLPPGWPGAEPRRR